MGVIATASRSSAAALNARLEAEGLSPRVANLGTVWTTDYTVPSRYNWMLQSYLRAEGLALGWTGTGRFMFSLAYGEAEFAEVADRYVAAARAMRADGWTWCAKGTENKTLRRQILREMWAHRRGSGEIAT